MSQIFKLVHSLKRTIYVYQDLKYLNLWPRNPHLGMYYEEIFAHVHKDPHRKMFVPTLFTVAKTVRHLNVIQKGMIKYILWYNLL